MLHYLNVHTLCSMCIFARLPVLISVDVSKVENAINLICVSFFPHSSLGRVVLQR